MSTQAHATVDESTVRQISQRLDEPEWLLEARLDALAALEDLEMPDVIRTPGRTWTNLDDLDYETLVEPLDTDETRERSVPDDDVEVYSIEEVVSERPELLEEHFGSVVAPQENYLTALSTALFSTGTVVYVPEGVDAGDVSVRVGTRSRSLFDYTLVVTERSASATVLQRVSTDEPADEGGSYYSGIVEIAAGENSHVQYGSLQDLDRDAYNYTVKRGEAADHATVEFVEANMGSRLTKTEVATTLAGEGSETKLVGAFFGTGDQHFDLDAKVWHRAEHTTADLVTRGVVDEEARSVYEGTQHVGRGAWDTSSYQRENTLMLSDDAEADAAPKLIINNHDTEASHSATVGQVDEEELFYMVSRGLGERQARDMLVEGFFVPVLEEIDLPNLREDVQDLVDQRLAR